MTFAEFKERMPRIHGKGSYMEIWLLAYPAIIMMISHTVMATIDTLMVSRLGTIELGAVSLGGILVWTFYSLFNGLIQSTNTFVAQYFGKGDKEECARFTYQGIFLAIISGIILYSLSHTGRFLFEIMGPSEQVQIKGNEYLSISMIGGGFFLVYLNLSCFFRGTGDTKTPMKVAIVANIVNVIGDYLLIFGKFGFPRMEVEGAAVATVFSSFVGAMIFLILFLSKKINMEYKTRSTAAFSSQRMWRMIKIGIPTGVQYLLDMGSFLVFSAYIGRMGDSQLAANHIVIRIMSFSFMPCYGISIAATSLVGQYIGAKDIRTAEMSGFNAIKIGILYTAMIAATFLIFSSNLTRIFSTDPSVVEFARNILVMAAFFQVFDGITMISSGSLRGAGDTRWPMVAMILCSWLLFIPLMYLFGGILGGGVTGAWVGGTIYITTLGVALLIRFKGGAWKKMTI
jgi:MATE family multidrug resistance protein